MRQIWIETSAATPGVLVMSSSIDTASGVGRQDSPGPRPLSGPMQFPIRVAGRTLSLPRCFENGRGRQRIENLRLGIAG